MNFSAPPPRLDPSGFTHAVVVLTIIIAATILTAIHRLDSTTLSTVYGAGMGYATGLTVGRKSEAGS